MQTSNHVQALLAAVLLITCNVVRTDAQEFHAGVRHLAQAGSNITGGPGNNTLNGGTGMDTISAGAGNDTVAGAAGNDTVTGGPGNDVIRGGRGNDTLYGNPGDDRIFGEPGDDLLYGGPGADTLEGGNGSDTLNIGPAGDDDEATGGPGLDTIIMAGVETCSEPCIPTDDELGSLHPSCVATDCVHMDGGSRCVVTGPRLCQDFRNTLDGAPTAAAGPISDMSPAGAPDSFAGFLSELPSTQGCGLDLYPTCCQGGLRGVCNELGECGVLEDASEECELGDELNDLVPGSSPAVLEEASGAVGFRRSSVSGLVLWILGAVGWQLLR